MTDQHQEEEGNIFDRMQTIEGVSPDKRKEIVADLESIQNAGKLIDFFVDKFLKTLTTLISKEN